MENLYEILEVSKNASPEVIDKAYKTLAKKYHPDVSQDKEKAEKMMKKLNSAYEILSNPKTREEYDYNLNQEELTNNNVQSEIKKEENKVQYNTYYNIQNNQEQQNDDNIYNNYYVQENDYANNLNLFKRIRNIKLDKNTKIFLLIVLFIIILLIIKLFLLIEDLFKPIENEKINNDKTSTSTNKEDEEYPINDMTPINLVNQLFDDLKEYNIEKINGYLTVNTKFSINQIKDLNNDKKVYQYIIENSEYVITDYKVTNKKATINVVISSFNIESVISEYREWIKDEYENLLFDINYLEGGLQLIDNETLVEKAVQCLKKRIDEKEERKIEIIVDNTQEGWKINFNAKNILGTNLL